jgi:hypothetical protein
MVEVATSGGLFRPGKGKWLSRRRKNFDSLNASFSRRHLS